MISVTWVMFYLCTHWKLV